MTNLRKKVLSGLAALLVSASLMPKTAEARPKLRLSAGYEMLLASPSTDYVNDENAKYNSGHYTSGTIPLNQNPLSTGGNLGMLVFDVSALWPINQKWSLGPVIGAGFGNQSYSASGDFAPGFPMSREEKIRSMLLRAGAKESFKITDRLNLTAEQFLGIARVSIDSNLTWRNSGTGVTRTYTANPSGTGHVGSLKLGAEYDITKNICGSFDFGYNFGKVSTSGTQTRTQATSTASEYNPSFSFNSVSISGKAGVKF